MAARVGSIPVVDPTPSWFIRGEKQNLSILDMTAFLLLEFIHENFLVEVILNSPDMWGSTKPNWNSMAFQARSSRLVMALPKQFVVRSLAKSTTFQSPAKI